MEEMIIFTVFEVSAHLRQVIETQIDELYVRGEVSNFVRHSSGHIYFNLKDDNATLRCTFFRRANLALDFELKDGVEVVCFGKLTLFEKGGTYNLNVYKASLSGKGDLSRRFEQLKARLNEEGLFDSARKRPLPRYPQKIGIITSPTGAALQDISNILRRRFPVQAEVFPALVQGPEAPAQLIAGIRYFDSRDDMDLVILTRGGGSQEDLWCFNDEGLARAIYQSRHPLISAVGHEIDFSIADFVADLRAPTPSAAAELAVPDKNELQGYLNALFERISLKTRIGLERAGSAFNELRHEFVRFHPEAMLERMQQRLDLASGSFEQLAKFLTPYRHQTDMAAKELAFQGQNISQKIADGKTKLEISLEPRMTELLKVYLEKTHQNLEHKQQILNLRSPNEMLERGFAYISNQQGHIKSVDQVALADTLTIRLADGKLKSVVSEINKDKGK